MYLYAANISFFSYIKNIIKKKQYKLHKKSSILMFIGNLPKM